MNAQADILSAIPLFHSLGKDALEKLARSVRTLSLEPGDTLFRKGDDGSSMYIMQDGTIKIVLPSSVGEEIIVALMKKNDFFGAMALLDGEPRSADAVAIAKTELLVLGRDDFLSILQSDINSLKTILCDLSGMIRRTDDFLEDVCFFNISTRLAKKLVDLAERSGKTLGETVCIDLSLKQKELGDMIGATRESVNKELTRLRKEGIIELKQNRIIILDLEQLKERAF